MAEIPGCDPVAENGCEKLQEKMLLPVNGKRPLDSENTALGADANGLPTAKKLKTLQNGVDHPPVPQSGGISELGSAEHNGDVGNVNGDPHFDKGGTAAASHIVASHRDVFNGGADKVLEMDINTVRSEPKPMTDNGSISADEPQSSKERTAVDQGKLKVQDSNFRPIKSDIQNDMKVGASAVVPGATAGAGDAEPEIITLSDSEDEFQEVLNRAMSPNSSEMTRCRLLKLYRCQLRAEDTKLILLRKLKQSLGDREKQQTANAVTEAGVKMSAADVRGNTIVSTGQRSSGIGSSGGNIPPPLKRGHHQQQQLQSQHGAGGGGHFNQHSSSHHHKISANLHHTANHTAATGDSRAKLTHQSNGGSSSGPPPLVNMAKSSPHQSANGNTSAYSGYQTSQSVSKKVAAPVAPPPPPQLTAEQKLAAMRITLKKQVEQALQQIPAPKPPPPEVNFLPSLASGEFVYLIGMEEVVKQLLSTDQNDVKFVFNPFSCIQCDTDFTPVWKRDKPGSKNVICEKCITSNQKRVLKKEHTSKLKAVFAKALQKEHEIERRIAAGSPLSDMPGLAAVAAARQQQHQSHSSHGSSSSSAAAAAAAAAGAAAAASASSAPSMPQLTPQHAQSASPNTQTQLPPQLQQHHALLQAAQAEQMRALLAAQMLPYQMYGVSNKQAADLHRQYFLDMINQNRSWKT